MLCCLPSKLKKKMCKAIVICKSCSLKKEKDEENNSMNRIKETIFFLVNIFTLLPNIKLKMREDNPLVRRDAKSPGLVLINDGGRDKKLRTMEEERNKEYNDFLSKKVKKSLQKA